MNFILFIVGVRRDLICFKGRRTRQCTRIFNKNSFNEESGRIRGNKYIYNNLSIV